jgi:glycyl-tRNA synthetase
MAEAAFMDKLTALCKRRGFIYQSSEIYGGIGGFWDYGPLGVELKRNIKNQWWHDMVTNPPAGPDGHEIEMVGVDCSIIMNPKVWEASGHATGFADPMVTCKAEKCRRLFRADQLWLAVDSVPPNVPPFTFSRDLAFSTCIAGSEHDARQLLGDQPSRQAVRMAGGNRVARGFYSCDSYHRRHLQQKGSAQLPAHLASTTSMPTIQDDWRTQVPCPECRTVGLLTEPRQFNLMFKTHVGALEDASSLAYLRPETAQGIFANFKNVLDTTRVKVPFGIGQVGKSFRNEINPRNYTFRSREFEQMEIEFFCHERDSMQWYEFWRKVRYDWYVNLGLKSEKLRLRDQGKEELAHYSKACADIEYLFPFSDEHQELEGVAHRGNFDLTQHAKFSGKDLTYFDDEAWERDRANFGGDKDKEKAAKTAEPYRFLPTVIEPSAGADRATLAFLCEAYTEDQAPDEKGVMQTRVVMKFHPKLAPTKVAVFPLVNKEGMPDIAAALYKDLKKHMTAFFDTKGAIGRRYRRQDEVGTPFCVTVDGDTLKDGTVTIRDRDTLAQIRVKKEGVLEWVQGRLGR